MQGDATPVRGLEEPASERQDVEWWSRGSGGAGTGTVPAVGDGKVPERVADGQSGTGLRT